MGVVGRPIAGSVKLARACACGFVVVCGLRMCGGLRRKLTAGRGGSMCLAGGGAGSGECTTRVVRPLDRFLSFAFTTARREGKKRRPQRGRSARARPAPAGSSWPAGHEHTSASTRCRRGEGHARRRAARHPEREKGSYNASAVRRGRGGARECGCRGGGRAPRRALPSALRTRRVQQMKCF